MCSFSKHCKTVLNHSTLLHRHFFNRRSCVNKGIVKLLNIGLHKYCEIAEILCSSRVSVILYSVYILYHIISSPLFLCLMKDFNLSQLCVVVPSGCVVNMAVTLTGISCSWENHHQSAALVLLALLKKDVDEFCFNFNWNNIKYCMQYIILTFSPNFLKWI